MYTLGMKQYYNISIYCNNYYSNTIQYSLKEISIYCTLQYIVMLQYFAMFVVLIYKCSIITPQKWLDLLKPELYTWVSHAFIQLYRVYILFFTAITHIPIWNIFIIIQSNIALWQYIGIHSNTIIWHWSVSFHP